MTKRVLMLSWEYPPRIIGGLARVVAELSAKIAKSGWEVHVVTADHPGQPEHKTIDGVHVHRVKNQTDNCPDFLTWVNRLNFGMLQYAIELNRQKPFSIVHAHDWMVTDAAWVMKTGFGIPIVSTMHATEAGRMHGIHNDLQRYIHQMEWRLTYESWEVIVNSQHMWGELQNSFSLPQDKLVVIPNGTNPEVFDFELDKKDLRARYAAPDQKIVLFVGRMVPEKGVQVLLNAIPYINAYHPNTRYLFVGDGYFLNELKAEAHNLNVSQLTNFLGYVSDAELLKLYKIADIVAIPSLYEPFGIVALEGMAAKVPVVTSDTGGLTDFVEHMVTGITTYAGDAGSLAWGVRELLQNHDLYKRLQTDAYEKARNIYNWTVIAKRTMEVYDKVLAEANKIGADGVASKPKQATFEAAKTMPPTLPKELMPARERS